MYPPPNVNVPLVGLFDRLRGVDNARDEAAAPASLPLPPFDHDPGMQHPFGYKTSWIAVRCVDPGQVAAALGLAPQLDVGWTPGVKAALADGTFIAPEVDGWVFAVGSDFVRCEPGLVELSRTLAAEVQWFGSHRVSGTYWWASADRGALLRDFHHADGMVQVDEGNPTLVEREIARIASWLGRPAGWFPEDDDGVAFVDENDPLLVAAEWSVDPMSLTAPDHRLGIWGRWVGPALRR